MEKERTMREELYRKFTEVPTRPGRGGTYSYIKWQDVADRMNKIFGIKWSSEVVYQDVVGTNVVTRVRVTVTDTDTTNKFCQEGFGGAPMDDRQEAGNPFKAAYSKALKDACKKWGIGLYLEDDEPETVQPAVIVPPTQPTVVTSPLQSAVIVPPIQPAAVEMPVIPKINIPVQPISTDTVTPTNDVVIPIIPPIPVNSVSDNKVIGGQTTISDVQKAALQSILNIQGVEYDELIKGAFTSRNITLPNPVPIMDDLSYDDAVIVVKYGNDNFRKR